jgi:hypothetical protein
MSFDRRCSVSGYALELCPHCRHKRINPQKLALIPRPMTWDSVVTWIEAEAHIRKRYQNRKLQVGIIISQANKVKRGYELLEKIRNFIADQLGIQGRIYSRDNIYELGYRKTIETYELGVVILPYMRHPAKINAVVEMLREIERHTKELIALEKARLQTAEPRKRGYIIARLKRAQKQLADIQKIKQKYPYIKEILG